VTASNAPDFAALGIASSAVEVMEAAVSEPTLVAEAAERASRRPPPVRRRAGPLPAEDRAVVTADAVASLRRTLLGLLLASDNLGEVGAALARVGLQLRGFPPTADDLAERLRKSL
jgi:hypothetical protein